MNIENINKLIAHLKRIDPYNFDMGDWLRHYPHKKEASEVLTNMERKGGCGTVACLAGHAVILEAAETGRSDLNNSDSMDGDFDFEGLATGWLGIDWEQANRLFYRTDYRLKPSDAIPVLEHLRDTGEVNWKYAPLYKDYKWI